MKTDREEIEQIIGRPLAEEELGSVSHLNRFPPALLDEARRIMSPLLRHCFLRMLVEPGSRCEVRRFDEAVFEQGNDAATWRRGGLLVPWFTAQELIVRPISDILAPLGHSPGRSWVRMPVDGEGWRRNEWHMGAPAVERPELDYRSVVALHAMRFLGSWPGLEAVVDVAVATRRWIAARVAQEARRTGLGEAWLTVDELASRIGVTEPLSPDGVMAVKALLAERSLPPLPPDEVPGFRGPDRWYAAGVPGGHGRA